MECTIQLSLNSGNKDFHVPWFLDGITKERYFTLIIMQLEICTVFAEEGAEDIHVMSSGIAFMSAVSTIIRPMCLNTNKNCTLISVAGSSSWFML